MGPDMIYAVAQAAPDSVFGLATKGGIMMIPIVLCSLVVVAVVLERLTVLRRERVVPKGFEQAFANAMKSGGTRRAIEVCSNPPSPAGRVLAAGLAKLVYGHEIVEKHLASAGEHEVYLLRRRLRMLTVVAAVAPLLGLTGTIFGMIRAFQTVALSGESLGKAELLAGGIYEAMITTAAGLLVAIPTVIFYHLLASKVDRLARDLDCIAVGFVERHALGTPGPDDRSPRTSSGAPENQKPVLAAPAGG